MAEPVHGPSAPGSVVLDLGPCTGAVIVHAPPELDGREIQIRPRDPSAGPGTHSLVRTRHTASGVQHAAVYPDLRPGEYVIWLDSGSDLVASCSGVADSGSDLANSGSDLVDRGELSVTVAGGRVTIARWPAS